MAPQTLVTEGDSSLQPGTVRAASDGSLLAVFVAATTGGPGEVDRVDPVTGVRTVVSAGGLLVNPSGLAIDRDGSLLDKNLVDASLTIPGNVVRIDPATGAQSVAYSGGHLFAPGDLVVAPNGDLYVTNTLNDVSFTAQVLVIPTNAARNVISGNSGDGVHITGSGTTGNVVEGNYIGVNCCWRCGSRERPIRHPDRKDAADNTIGGTTVGSSNVISGNGTDATLAPGILIDGVGATNNVVHGNYIGLNAAGDAAIANQGDGIWIADGASNNQIGGGVGFVAGKVDQRQSLLRRRGPGLEF